MIKPPAKSILKRLPTSSASLHDAAPAREATPEPTDPLACVEFLKTPIDALVASLSMAEYTIGLEQLFKPSQHDLTEAYGTLGSRLRAHFKGSGTIELTSDVLALDPLKAHAESLAKAFVRDLGRPTADPGPLSSDSSDESFTDASTQSADELAPDEPSSSPVGATKKPKKKGVSAAQITYARDAFMLTQAAIRTVAMILSSPVLYGCFSGEGIPSCAVLAPLTQSFANHRLRALCHPPSPPRHPTRPEAVHSQRAQDDHAGHVVPPEPTSL